MLMKITQAGSIYVILIFRIKIGSKFLWTWKGVNIKFDPNVTVIFEYEKIQIFRAFLHVSWNLLLGTKKDTTKEKYNAGRYA